MNNSLVSKINTIVLYLFSAALALGTINPFALSQSEDTVDSSMTIIFTIVFVIIVALRYGIKKLSAKIVIPVLLLFVGFVLGDFIYDLTTANLGFLLRFGVVLFCFYEFIVYFSNNPEMIEKSLVVYSITCVLVLLFVYFSGVTSIMTVSKGRLSIFGENANSTSSRMVFAVLFFIYDIIHNKRILVLKILESLSILLLLYFIIQSGSRGSLLSVAFGLLLLVSFSHIRSRRKWFILSIVFVVALFALPYLMNNDDISILNRLEELKEGNVRTILMANAVDIYMDYPFFGAGANGYQVEKSLRGYSYLDSHCIITSIMAIGGTLSLFAFLALWLTVFVKTIKLGKSNILPLVIMVCITFIALKTGGVITYVLMWYCYAICYSMGYSSKTNFNNDYHHSSILEPHANGQ